MNTKESIISVSNILDGIPNGFIIFDSQYEILFINQRGKIVRYLPFVTRLDTNIN